MGRSERLIDVTLGFTLRVEGDIDAERVGRQLCLLIETPGHIGNPDWIATPIQVIFLKAEERDPWPGGGEC